MLKRGLILLLLAATQAGCSIEEGVGPYRFTPMTSEAREVLERQKREFLKIEDLKIGDGPLAAWSRRLEANISVKYTDGTLAYEGPLWINIGFDGDVFVYNATNRAGALDYGQPGIWMGLNGMAVGGTRRITIAPKLVDGVLLIKGTFIRKEQLIVEATLTASCIPVLLRAIHLPTSRYMIEREVWCSSSSEPQRSPNDPIWRMY